MADRLIEGNIWAGLTGLQGGARLENLVKLAKFTNNTELLDNIYLTTVNIGGDFRATIKDKSVDAAKMADDSIGPDQLVDSSLLLGGPIPAPALLFANVINQGWGAVNTLTPITDQTDLTEATNDNDTLLANTGTTIAGSGSTTFIDLGARYQGTIKFLADISGSAASANSVKVITESGALSWTPSSNNAASEVLMMIFQDSTTRTVGFIQNFYGQHVGIEFVSTQAISVQFRRFEVHGVLA